MGESLKKERGLFKESAVYGLVGALGAFILTYMEISLVDGITGKTRTMAYLLRVFQTYLVTLGFIYLGGVLNRKMERDFGKAKRVLEKGFFKRELKKRALVGISLGLFSGIMLAGMWTGTGFSWVVMSSHFIINKGIVEEIVYRYGLATFIIYILQKVAGRSAERAKRVETLTILLTAYLGAAFTAIPLLQIPSVGGREIAGIMIPNAVMGIMMTKTYIKEGMVPVLFTTIAMHATTYIVVIPLMGMLVK